MILRPPSSTIADTYVPYTMRVRSQRFMCRRRTGTHDRPVAQDEILDCRANPPGGISGKAHLALRLETGGRLHQAEITFLDRSEENTSELQSLMRFPYVVFCLITNKT